MKKIYYVNEKEIKAIEIQTKYGGYLVTFYARYNRPRTIKRKKRWFKSKKEMNEFLNSTSYRRIGSIKINNNIYKGGNIY